MDFEHPLPRRAAELDGPRLAGEVWVADIGMPLEVYAELGIEVPLALFSTGDRFRL